MRGAAGKPAVAIESRQSPLSLPRCRLFGKVQTVEQPAGACLAITREAWDAVGGMDPQFAPVWFEDVDFCKRLLDSGRKIVYCPSARFHHSGAHSVGKLSFADKQLFWYTNMLRYARKHFSASKGAGFCGLGLSRECSCECWLRCSGQDRKMLSAAEAVRAYRA